ncbi:MAG: phosphatidate cytidylyltransferase [Pseudomonadota bacterium]
MKRIITAILLGGLVLAAVLWLPRWGVYALVIIASAIGLFEFGRMFLKDLLERWAAIIAGMLACVAMVLYPAAGNPVLLILAFDLFALALIFMWRANEVLGIADKLALAIMGVLYLGVVFPFWAWVAALTYGKELVLIGLVPACLCDMFALIAGKSFGRRRLAPLVSPNKTVEGLIGALVGSFGGAFLMRSLLMPQMPLYHIAILAAIIWITSPFGDLVESLLKRSSGVKDSGSIIPGHGGVLDRLDALIFTGPAVYAYAVYVMGI